MARASAYGNLFVSSSSGGLRQSYLTDNLRVGRTVRARILACHIHLYQSGDYDSNIPKIEEIAQAQPQSCQQNTIPRPPEGANAEAFTLWISLDTALRAEARQFLTYHESKS